jgi:large subunit ribosomal protein L29
MAKNKTIELKAISLEELKSELNRSKDEYTKMQFDHAATGLGNPMVLVEARKNIARLNTELRSRELSGKTEAELAKRSKIRARRRKQ